MFTMFVSPRYGVITPQSFAYGCLDAVFHDKIWNMKKNFNADTNPIKDDLLRFNDEEWESAVGQLERQLQRLGGNPNPYTYKKICKSFEKKGDTVYLNTVQLLHFIKCFRAQQFDTEICVECGTIQDKNIEYIQGFAPVCPQCSFRAKEKYM